MTQTLDEILENFYTVLGSRHYLENKYGTLTKLKDALIAHVNEARLDERSKAKIDFVTELLEIIKADRTLWTDTFTLNYLEEHFTKLLNQMKNVPIQKT